MRRSLIVTIADSANLLYTRPLFLGVRRDAGWKGECMLLTDAISATDRRWYEDRDILVREIPPPCSARDWYGMQKKPVCPPVVSLVFELFGPVFRDWDTILYLDNDIIIRGPLDVLTRVSAFSAVGERFVGRLRDQFIDSPEARRALWCRFDPSVRAFNSGVMAFAPSPLLHGTRDELLSLFGRYYRYGRFTVQSILNLHFCGKWKRLPMIANTYVHAGTGLWGRPIGLLEAAHAVPGSILHFRGPGKPWIPGALLHHEWRSALEASSHVASFAKGKARRPRNGLAGQVWCLVYRLAVPTLILAKDLRCRLRHAWGRTA